LFGKLLADGVLIFVVTMTPGGDGDIDVVVLTVLFFCCGDICDDDDDIELNDD